MGGESGGVQARLECRVHERPPRSRLARAGLATRRGRAALATRRGRTGGEEKRILQRSLSVDARSSHFILVFGGVQQSVQGGYVSITRAQFCTKLLMTHKIYSGPLHQCSPHLGTLPVVLIVGVATSAAAIHSLPHSSSCLLCVEQFSAPSSIATLNLLIEKV